MEQRPLVDSADHDTISQVSLQGTHFPCAPAGNSCTSEDIHKDGRYSSLRSDRSDIVIYMKMKFFPPPVSLSALTPFASYRD